MGLNIQPLEHMSCFYGSYANKKSILFLSLSLSLSLSFRELFQIVGPTLFSSMPWIVLSFRISQFSSYNWNTAFASLIRYFSWRLTCCILSHHLYCHLYLNLFLSHCLLRTSFHSLFLHCVFFLKTSSPIYANQISYHNTSERRRFFLL